MTKILIAEREPEVNKSLKDFFQTLGYTTFITTSPEEAVEITERENPNVLIIDVRMRSELRLDVIKAIRRIDKNIKVIVMSTYYKGDEEFKEIEALKVDRYYEKPVNIAKILDDVRIMTKDA